MDIRHLSRQRVLQLLYAAEFAPAGAELDRVRRLFMRLDRRHKRGWGPFAAELAECVHGRAAELDEAIAPLLRGWKLDRLPLVERLCLRMALAELRHFPDIPLRVTVDEYVELVREFSNDEAFQYVNAVLDHLARRHPEKDFRIGPDGRHEPRPEPAHEPEPASPNPPEGEAQ